MYQYRLNQAQFRRWNRNLVTLSTEDGQFIRYATPDEAYKLGKARERGVTLILEDTNGMKLIPGQDRDRMRAEVVAKHGDSQLRFGSRMLATVRDPNVQRARFADGPRQAPDPERCECAKWDGRRPGRHHRLCSHNPLAPRGQRGDLLLEDILKVSAAERGPSLDEPKPPVEEQPTTETLVVPSEGATETLVVSSDEKGPSLEAAGRPEKPVEGIPSPDTCECKKWGHTKTHPKISGQHHSVCKHYDEWKKLHPVPTYYLVSIETGERLREALEAEIWEAEKNAADPAVGTSTAKVDGRDYIVLGCKAAAKMKDEMDEAAPEEDLQAQVGDQDEV